MVNYRRNRIPGGTYFFTAALHNRSKRLLVEHIHILRTALRHTLRKQPFSIDAIVVLPDHLHTIWTLPSNDSDYAGRWRSIKSRFTRDLARTGMASPRTPRGEYDVWQLRYWEHSIRDETDLNRHVDYIHFNPVKHGLADRVRDWPYSSFHRYAERGLYPPDWAGSCIADDEGDFGE